MSDHWGTPDSIWRLVDSLGVPRKTWFDPCPFNGEKIADGLKIPWKPCNFVNPPFSNPRPWIEKAHDEWMKNVSSTIMVLPSYTDRKWFINMMQPLLFLHKYDIQIVHIGRHAYIPLDGQKTSSPRFGSCLVGWNIPGFYWLHDRAMKR